MAICLLLFITVIIGNWMLSIYQANALEKNSSMSLLRSFLGYVIGNFEDIPLQPLDPPENTKISIQFLLYTPDRPETPCHLEPNLDALKRCSFHSDYPIKFLIHGFLTTMHPGVEFMMIKDEILKIYQYNVIVVDWSPYNQMPYIQAAINSRSVSHELTILILFLKKFAYVDVKNIHLIGHSLGAQLSGDVGEKVPNLGRITGLDPVSRFFAPHALLHQLTPSDADFVDIIHSSNYKQGFGEQTPMGDMDFYPNGGESQPHCHNKSKSATFLSEIMCNHAAAVLYFLQSVNSCSFLASKCDSYSDFQKGLCSKDSSFVAEMGLRATPIYGLPPKSAFFLRTSSCEPYCLPDDYEPK